MTLTRISKKLIDQNFVKEVTDLTTELAKTVKSVNGKSPDANGNIVVDGSVDTTNLATKSYVQEEILKVNTGGTVDISGKADLTYVDEELAKTVKTVNGINPDVNGNVTVDGGFSGSYTDLINKPTIPSKTSDLTNDSGFITSTNISLSDLTDVDVTNKVDGYALRYDNSTGKVMLKSLPISSGGDGATINDASTTSTSETWSANKINTSLGGKVDKVAGKGLSTNDYTADEKTKLAGIASGANNYSHPSEHPASMITLTDSANNFTATHVEGAMSELFTSVSNGKNSIETAITDKGGTVSKVGTIAAFAELVTGIQSIPIGGSSNWKMVSGTAEASGYYIEVNGIEGFDFIPSLVIARFDLSNSLNNSFIFIDTNFNTFGYIMLHKINGSGVISSGLMPIRDVGHFECSVPTISGTYDWIAMGYSS